MDTFLDRLPVHHYQHHIGDYDTHTSHLTWDEDMAYTRLLRIYYRDEKPIPKSFEILCRMTKAKTEKQRRAVRTVLDEFFIELDDGLHNKRADEELRRFWKKSAGAKAAAEARWEDMRTQCERIPAQNANAMPTATRKPLPVNQESPNGDSHAHNAPSEPLPDVAVAWNSIPRVVHVTRMSKSRKAALALRMTDGFWAARWKDGIDRIAKSAFLQGEGGSGWRADFDWFLKPDSLTKVLEGKYDDRPTPGTGIARHNGHPGGATAVSREADRMQQQLRILADYAAQDDAETVRGDDGALVRDEADGGSG